MYTPAHFDEHRGDAIGALLDAHPLGALVVDGPRGLDANHLPFLYDRDAGAHGCLRAHVARANPLCTAIADGAPVLVIFRGAEAYISPNWYPSKPETHRHAPTWNYQVVHVHGRLHLRDDEKYVRQVIARLTHAHEARTGDAQPWKMGDAPTDYLDTMVRAIVGIEIEIERIEAKSKLGQNREDRDRLGAADRLQARGHTELAAAMRAAESKQ